MFNAVVLLFFFVVCFSHDHKFIGRVSFSCYLIYILFIAGIKGTYFTGLGGEWFYHMTALMNAVIAYVVCKKYKLFSILSFAATLLCIVGYQMWENYHSPMLYDTLAVIITILQVLLLGARVITNAINVKGIRGRAIFRILNFDSFKSYHEVPLQEGEAEK